MRDLLKWLHDGNWDAGASVLGVCISIVGFVITVIQVTRSKSAAKRTEEAVEGVRASLALQTVAGDLTALLSEIEEMKELHRQGHWTLMPVRYAAVRRKLLSIRGSCPTLTRAQKSSILGVIEQFRDIEQIIEQTIASKTPPKDVALLNKLAAEQSDKLTEVLIAVQQEMKNSNG